MIHTRKFFFVLTISFLLHSAGALAKDTGLEGFNVQRFSPNFDGYGVYNVYGSQVLPHLKFSAGLFANFSRRLANIDMPARGSTLDAVQNNLTMDFVAAIGIKDFMDVGLGIPFTPLQGVYNYNDLQRHRTSAMGDLRLDIKFEAFKDAPRSVGLGFLSEATFPSGNRGAFMGNDGVTWEGKAILGKTFKPVSLYANAGYRFMKAVRVLSTAYDDVLTFGGGVNARLPFHRSSWILKAEVTGETVANNMSREMTPVEVRAGVRKEFRNGLALEVGGGRGLTSAIGSPQVRIFAGLSFNSFDRSKKMGEKKAITETAPIDYTVTFDFDRYDISEDQLSKLQDAAGRILSGSQTGIILEGYTDSTGSKSYNMALSEKRAQSVKAVLVKCGIPSDRIESFYFGEEKPVSPNSTRDGRGQNRRVEIHAGQ